jgi:TonB family protein
MNNRSLTSWLAAISILLFFSIASADQPDATPPKELPFPKLKSLGGGYYPDAAKARGVEGKVIIGFDIAANGRATNIGVVYSDDRVFEKMSMDILKSAIFELPKDEDGQVIHESRYRLGFVYCLPPSSLDSTFPMRVLPPVVVSGSRIRGSPVRNPPAAGATGQCAEVQWSQNKKKSS